MKTIWILNFKNVTKKYKTRAGVVRAARRLIKEEGGNINDLLESGFTSDVRGHKIACLPLSLYLKSRDNL